MQRVERIDSEFFGAVQEQTQSNILELEDASRVVSAQLGNSLRQTVGALKEQAESLLTYTFLQFRSEVDKLLDADDEDIFSRDISIRPILEVFPVSIPTIAPRHPRKAVARITTNPCSTVLQFCQTFDSTRSPKVWSRLTFEQDPETLRCAKFAAIGEALSQVSPDRATAFDSPSQRPAYYPNRLDYQTRSPRPVRRTVPRPKKRKRKRK